MTASHRLPAPERDSLEDLLAFIRSRIPLVQIESLEETRIIHFLKMASVEDKFSLHLWSVADGFQDSATKQPASKITPISFHDALVQIREGQRPMGSVSVFLDPQAFLNDPVNLRLIKEIAQDYPRRQHTLLLLGPKIELPVDLARLGVRFSPRLPDATVIHDLYLEQVYRWLKEKPGRAFINPAPTEALLLQYMAGLTEDDVRRLSDASIRDDGRLSKEDLDRVLAYKRQTMGQEGLLEFVFTQMSFEDIGGLAGLRHWLELRRSIFLDDHVYPGLDAPKGILLIGVQGSGKSLAAKAIAGSWQVPLVRLDFGVLYAKFLGETERNLRMVLKQAEAMSPCVLWIDEIEKGLSSDASGVTDGGVSRRLLGTVLTWMAERTAKVFLVATANDVSQLPPELMRKGRIDEIFFLDLPGASARKEIFKIHLKKRQLHCTDVELDQLAHASEGFSGSEIEQAIVAAMYAAIAVHQSMRVQHLLEEISQTRPLSIVMSEKMTQLRQWAKGRTVFAGTESTV
jgi:SpoVK/Ycf46/Vps4 family AAA+-type ATPase